MNDLKYALQHELNNIHGLILKDADIADAQRTLVDNKIIPIPNSFINFLEEFNGINYNGGEIFGINPPSNLSGDVVDINIQQERLIKSNYLILGVDDFDYLIYNQKESLYQIIDKTDLEVLEEYTDIAKAISHILKV